MVERKVVIVATYVDDLLNLYNDQQLVNQMKQQLCAEFMMKDLGPSKQMDCDWPDGTALRQSVKNSTSTS